MQLLRLIATRVLRLPAFLLAVSFMYWSVPLGILMGHIRTLKLSGSRNDAYGWGRALQQLFGIKLLQVPGPGLYKGGPCIWMCNHRSWADFFVDVLTTQGDSQMLSRMAVAAVFPMFMISVVIIRSVILFKRGAIRDKEGFNRMIDRMMSLSPVNGLNVYPEGHRSTATDSLPLRRGMMHFAYSRQMPVQIIVTAGKEAVISEKDMSAHFGQTLLVGYSNVLHPKDYSSAEEFFEAIKKSWSVEWQRVNGFDWGQAIPFQTGGVDFEVHYTATIKALSIISQGASLVCFFGFLYASWRALWWILSCFGRYSSVAAAAAALWVAASVLHAQRTVSPTASQAAQQRVVTGPDAAREEASHSLPRGTGSVRVNGRSRQLPHRGTSKNRQHDPQGSKSANGGIHDLAAEDISSLT